MLFQLDKARPHAEARHPELLSPDAPLFASKRSGQQAGLGKLLKKAFQRMGGKNLLAL
jgi:hypothetical protein